MRRTVGTRLSPNTGTPTHRAATNTGTPTALASQAEGAEAGRLRSLRRIFWWVSPNRDVGCNANTELIARSAPYHGTSVTQPSLWTSRPPHPTPRCALFPSSPCARSMEGSGWALYWATLAWAHRGCTTPLCRYLPGTVSSRGPSLFVNRRNTR
jgi:hypothetical protein